MKLEEGRPALRVVAPGIASESAGNGNAVKRTAQEQVELDRLLPHEDPGSDRLEDAETWAGVYRELLDFKHSLIAIIDESFPGLTPIARTEIGRDRLILAAEADRLALRKAFWDRRVDELSGNGAGRARRARRR